MNTFIELQNKYKNKDFGDLGKNQLTELRNKLQIIKSNEVTNYRDASTYLEILSSFRKAITEIDVLHGQNYRSMIESVLSVGEDGLYSNKLRFIYELIQNVDDCTFLKSEDCSLDIKFDDSKETGKIVLSYNEIGFSPFNVFAITGVAEAAKNVEKDKVEIGEKGIGFKSVFGIAEKVWIQSGYFSFELKKNNFTVPVPKYENYEKVIGTKMTLFMSAKKVHDIYKSLSDEYCRTDTLLNKNLLLFLNKLTSLKMYYDSFKSLDFKIDRGEKKICDFLVEENIKLSVELKDRKNGIDNYTKNEIDCIRFSMQVNYDVNACKSRYGEETQHTSKRMNLSAIVPTQKFVKKFKLGTFYSFLPTQIKINAPMAIHAPFKLDASREFVDPQNENEWFLQSRNFLENLIDRLFIELAKIVKQDIAYYLPTIKNQSLFQETNEKVKCLYQYNGFKSEKILNLPIFCTDDTTMQPAKNILSISKKEAEDPEFVYLMLNLSKRLYNSPVDYTYMKFGIESVSNVNEKLFIQAFKNPEYTEDILDYLCSKKDFSFDAKDIEKIGETNLTVTQVKIFVKNEELYPILIKHSKSQISSKATPLYSISNIKFIDVRECLGKIEIEVDAPKSIDSYLKLINYKCLLVDFEDNSGLYLPTNNALILSAVDTQKAFANFCHDIDKNNNLSINLRIRAASDELNQLDNNNEITPQDYLEKLRGVRQNVKSSLGSKGYGSYLEIILKSGSDASRFINELLQNADDCIYPDDVIPTFELEIDKNFLKTTYNESGFNKSNVRAITAIGESTKKKIINKDHDVIGEKGVGFKTVFGIASCVAIHSGGFHFELTKQEPTIPSIIKEESFYKSGTTMFFKLDESLDKDLFTEQKILERCACLRNLKNLKIASFDINIDDVEDKRIITINQKKYTFIKMTYSFVANKIVVSEQQKNGKKINKNQKIHCYYPLERSNGKARLYNGLPTEIDINIPLLIDAPFELTTSRDHVLRDNSWNEMVKDNAYNAIKNMILTLKKHLRCRILALTGIENKSSLYNRSIGVNVFSDQFLNRYEWIKELKALYFIPTFDENIFVCPNDKPKRYPHIISYLIEKGEHVGISKKTTIDVSTNSEYNSTLDALDCNIENVDKVIDFLSPFIEKYMYDLRFRKKFYVYLKENKLSETSKAKLKKLPIIPVYGTIEGETDFVPWQDNMIFTKGGAKVSGASYSVLNIKVLQKSDCENILGVLINEMDSTYESGRYRSILKSKLSKLKNNIELYNYVLSEFTSGNLRKYDCLDVIRGYDGQIPLKNASGKIIQSKLFVDNQEIYSDYDIIKNITVHYECKKLGMALKLNELYDIQYDEFLNRKNLTDDEIEMFCYYDEYFKNYYSILQGFYDDGYISKELIEKYELHYLPNSRIRNEENYEFPNDEVKDIIKLREHIFSLLNKPTEIVKRKVERTVYKTQYNGKERNIDSNEIRKQTLKKYSPDEEKQICFCQMCEKPKKYNFIEVNNIEINPKYFWPQLRISLCLECSKKFKYYRGELNNNAYSGNCRENNKFIEAIKFANTDSDEPIKIPIGEDTITFTQTHLAEIQEIFRQSPNQP